MASISLPLRIICINPPAGLFGIQDKNREVMVGEHRSDGSLRFDLTLTAKKTNDGLPNFTGTFAHGSIKERFIYLTLKEKSDYEDRIVKRLKVHLKSITWDQVEDVLKNDNAHLQARVDGRLSASVLLLDGGWIIEFEKT